MRTEQLDIRTVYAMPCGRPIATLALPIRVVETGRLWTIRYDHGEGDYRPHPARAGARQNDVRSVLPTDAVGHLVVAPTLPIDQQGRSDDEIEETVRRITALEIPPPPDDTAEAAAWASVFGTQLKAQGLRLTLANTNRIRQTWQQRLRDL